MPASYDDARAHIPKIKDLSGIDDAHRTTGTQQKGITTSRVKGRTYYTAKDRKPCKLKGYGLRSNHGFLLGLFATK